MSKLKKLIAISTVLAMIGSTAHYLNAQDDDYYGYGYEDSRRVPSLSPAIALGTIALVAIVAVAVSHGSSNGHSHAH